MEPKPNAAPSGCVSTSTFLTTEPTSGTSATEGDGGSAAGEAVVDVVPGADGLVFGVVSPPQPASDTTNTASKANDRLRITRSYVPARPSRFTPLPGALRPQAAGASVRETKGGAM